MKEKVIVGLSGGVDSSVALYLLKAAGYDCEALFMRNWDAMTNSDVLGNPTIDDDICPQEVDYMDALKVAEKLDVPFSRVDFVDEYWQYVFSYFLEEYQKGRTPNPDILCNKEIKFKAFLNKALSLGAKYIAMGHYARVIHGEKNYLLRAKDASKDQTYFLSQLTSEQLAKVIFPIGDMEKHEVRDIAKTLNLVTATKKDSTGICFIGERRFKEFLKNYILAKPGLMQTIDGQTVGQHEGVIYYTIGQRHGLGIGGKGDPWFVIGKKVEENILLVGQGSDQLLLYGNKAIITDLNFINEPLTNNQTLTAKFRYRQEDVPVTVKWLDAKTLEVQCHTPVKAMTPGQACVFYDGQYCLGGGTIDKVYMDDELRPY